MRERLVSSNRGPFWIKSLLLTLAASVLVGCAGAFKPPPPLWEPGRYTTIAVLPSRMEISSGAPLVSRNTDLTNKYTGLVQEAIAVALVRKGYDVLAPLDVNETVFGGDELREVFMDLAWGAGVAPQEAYQGRTYTGSLESAPVLAEVLGADLLVLSAGEGEYHSAGESLVQGILTSVLTKGKHQYQAPASYLQARVVFVDPALQRTAARLRTGRFDYVTDIQPAANVFLRLFRRIPPGQKDNPE